MSGYVGPTSGLLYPLDQTAFDNTQAGDNNSVLPTVLIGQTLVSQAMSMIPVTSLPQAVALFGAGSHLCRIWQAYFANDQEGPIYCVPLADASGATKATCTVTVVGPATGNGTIFLYIAGQLVAVGVAAAATATAIAASIAAAVNANSNLPVTAAASAGVVTLTAQNGGTLGNAISVVLNYLGVGQQQVLPAGVSVSITAMAGGATDPVLTGIAALLGDQAARFIFEPYSGGTALAAMQAMMSFSTGRWAPNRKSRGHVFSALQGTVSSLGTYASGTLLDDPHMTVIAYENGVPTPPWEFGAAYLGAAAPSIRNQPNQPLQYLAINAVLPPPVGEAEASGGAFGKTTWQTLLGSGLALAQWGPAGNTPMILRAPTTYTTNAAGQPDQSYFDVTTMYTLMVIADMLESMEAQKWARVLLGSDGNAFAPGIPVVTPKTALAGLLSLYTQMVTLGLVEDASAMLAATTAAIDARYPNQLDILFAPYIVQGLIQINNTIQFRNYSAAAAAVLAS